MKVLTAIVVLFLVCQVVPQNILQNSVIFFAIFPRERMGITALNIIYCIMYKFISQDFSEFPAHFQSH